MDDRTEIRRDDDGELCGFVERDGDDWLAVTVFGAWFARFDDGAQARDAVRESGLDVLARRWQYRASIDEEWEVCCIVEASPQSVTIVVDYYPMPNSPRVVLAANRARDRDVLRPD